MRRAADIEIDSWPVGSSVRADAEHAVADAAGDRRGGVRIPAGRRRPTSFARRCATMVEPISSPRGLPLIALLGRLGAGRAANQRFEQSRRAVDELLYAEIARRARRSGARRARRRVQRAAARRGRRRRAAVRRGGPRRARDAAARRSRDDRHRAGVDVRPASAHAGRARKGARTRGQLSRRRRQGVAARPAGDPRRRTRRPRRAVQAERVRDPAGRRDQPVDPDDPPPRRPVPEPDAVRPGPVPGRRRRPTRTHGSRSAAARGAASARSFAQLEMRIVVARILERAPGLRAVDPEPAEVQFRAITLAPRGGVGVVLDRPPAPAH